MNDITLDKLTETDIELVRSWRNKPEVASYMYTDSFISKEQQQVWFNSLDRDKTRYWIIAYKGKKLGLASITGIDFTLNSCYWAFYLGDTSLRGAGIGSKIEFNVIEYVFNEIELNKLRCEVFVSNDKVISMHEKFGFRREAYYRQHCLKDGKFRDVVGLALLNSEWQVLKEKMKTKIYGKRD